MTYRFDYLHLDPKNQGFWPKRTTRQVKALDSPRFLVSFRIDRIAFGRAMQPLHSTTPSLCKLRKDLIRGLLLPQSVASISFLRRGTLPTLFPYLSSAAFELRLC